MNSISTLTQEQIDALLRDGDFPESVRTAAAKVIVVMTQDWCSQWQDMSSYLPDFTEHAAIFTVEYNRSPDFERILHLKESVFRNRQVPYVRYYRGGKLVHEANWMPRTGFAALLGDRGVPQP
jgi:hypothetical protein